MSSYALAGILAYVVAQFAVGAWVSRNMSSETDYIVAGRSLGPGLVAFSIFATWFGAEAIVASAGEIYANGLAGALSDPIGYGAAVLVAGLLMAGPLWRRGIITFADLLRQRFSPGVEKLFVIVLVPGSLFWAAAQTRAFGQILSSSAGIDITVAIVVAAALIAGYSVVGGLLADAITDVVQGIAVIIGLVVLAYFVAGAVGGIGAGLATVEPARLDVLSAGEDGWAGKLEKAAIVICGSLVAVELVSRYLGARSVTAASLGTVVGGVMYLFVGLIPMFLGLVGPRLLPDLKETEQIVPRLAEAHLPGIAYALFVGALISAILSVVHAALHAPASQLSHNIIDRLRPQTSAATRLRGVRLTTLTLSVVAFLLALRVESIKELVETASAFGSAGAFVVVMFGMFTRLGGPAAAVAGLGSGMIIWAWSKIVFGLKTPYLAGLAAAVVAYLVVAMLERRDHERTS